MAKNFVSFMPDVFKKIQKSGERVMQEACNIGQNWIVRRSFTGARHGRVYLVPGRKSHYTASAPGEYPASPTGELRKHIETLVELKLTTIDGIVGTPVEHGLILEKKKVSEGGRPWLARSLNEALPFIKKRLQEKWF